MISYVEYRYCIWDGLPIGESPVYQTIKFEHGVKVANRYARRMVTPMNHPPPRGEQHDTIRIHLGHNTHADPQRNHTQFRYSDPCFSLEESQVETVHQ
jgi:hypothetical protein